MKCAFLSGTVPALVLGLFITTLSLPTQAAGYEVDLSHSAIQFRISHMGVSILIGRFNKFSGRLNWDRENPATSTIEVTIDTASVDSNWAERDKHLRGDEFLDSEKYPTATFKSTRYAGDARGGTLEGVLTLHGVSKPMTLEVKAIGEGPDPWGGYRAGFEATTSLRRADFGITHNLGPASETMEFDLFIEGKRKLK